MAEKWNKERTMEGIKFDHRRENYYEYVDIITGRGE